MNESPLRPSRRIAIQQLMVAAGGLSVVSVTGCSKMLLASGKLLFGDPKLPSEFTKLTRVDLAKGTKTVLVVCSTPELVEAEYSTLKLDLIDGVTRRLRLNGVQIIKPDTVADWIDAHGGIGNDMTELAIDFKTADYIAWLDVQSFNLREPNSPKLLRGQTSGFVRVFKIEGEGDLRQAFHVYQTEFSMTYPEHQPISEQGKSATVFHKEYVARLSDQLAERFYDHRPGATY